MKDLTAEQESTIGDDAYHEKRLEELNVCGLCKHYDFEFSICEKHTNYGELVEMDSCNDYEEEV